MTEQNYPFEIIDVDPDTANLLMKNFSGKLLLFFIIFYFLLILRTLHFSELNLFTNIIYYDK